MQYGEMCVYVLTLCKYDIYVLSWEKFGRVCLEWEPNSPLRRIHLSIQLHKSHLTFTLVNSHPQVISEIINTYK